jgi:hypothetical protein
MLSNVNAGEGDYKFVRYSTIFLTARAGQLKVFGCFNISWMWGISAFNVSWKMAKEKVSDGWKHIRITYDSRLLL